MSKLKNAASTTICALATTFAAAVTASSAAFAGVTAQKIAESGDLNAAAIPLAATFVAASWAAMTAVGAKATKSEFKSLTQGSESQPQMEPGA